MSQNCLRSAVEEPSTPVASTRKRATTTDISTVRLRRYAASSWSLSASKRTVDVLVAASVLFVFALPMLLIALFVRLTSSGPAIFAQWRVGRGGHMFTIYKFRSMASNQSAASARGLTTSADQRITPIGRLLRGCKLDELPQFYNVLRGDMSLVGPRPKLPQYASLRDMPFRPGITGAASLVFRNEEAILSQVPEAQVELFYNRRIRPLKARIDVHYMARATPWSDIRILVATALSFVRPARTPFTLRRPLEPLGYPGFNGMVGEAE